MLLHVGLVGTLTVPFWVWSGRSASLAPGLPVAALAVVCPALAAGIVARVLDGRQGPAAWWQHARPVPPGPGGWLLCAVALPALVTALMVAIALLGQAMSPGPALHVPGLPLSSLLAFAGPALAGAWLEEAGWSAFSTETLRPAWPLLRTGLVIGLIWAAWHVIGLAQVSRGAQWIAWWTLGTLSMRVILVWLYTRAGHTIGAPVLFHAASNLCWQGQLSLGFEFDPRLHALLMTAVAAGVLAVERRARRA